MNLSQKLLSIEELATLLDVPTSWIYRRTSLGEIPYLKLGRYVRFDLNQVSTWLEEKQAGNGQEHD